MSESVPSPRHEPSGTLASIMNILSEAQGGVADCARLALNAAANGASVAVGLVGRPIIQRVRAHILETARTQVGRNIAEDAQRAFDKGDVVHSDGREWLVSRPGVGVMQKMTEDQFSAYRDDVAAKGGTLVTVVYRGTTGRDVSAMLTRYVGGVVDGANPETPAMVRATPQGVERVYFRSGQKLAEPEAFVDEHGPAVATPGGR